MAEHDREYTRPATPPGGISGDPTRNLRIELDAMLRRYGITDGVAGLSRITGTDGSGGALADLVRAEDHQRLNAPDRNSMRRAAQTAVSAPGWTEQHRGAFVAFVMKACVPDGSGTSWVIPFASWAEAGHAFLSLYRDQRVWEEYWREVH